MVGFFGQDRGEIPAPVYPIPFIELGACTSQIPNPSHSVEHNQRPARIVSAGLPSGMPFDERRAPSFWAWVGRPSYQALFVVAWAVQPTLQIHMQIHMLVIHVFLFHTCCMSCSFTTTFWEKSVTYDYAGASFGVNIYAQKGRPWRAVKFQAAG